MSDVEFAERLKTGRNEECPCGSKKKYKKCHLEADERAQAEALAKLNAEMASHPKAEHAEAHTHHDHPHPHPAAPKARTAPSGNRQVSAPRKSGGG